MAHAHENLAVWLYNIDDSSPPVEISSSLPVTGISDEDVCEADGHKSPLTTGIESDEVFPPSKQDDVQLQPTPEHRGRLRSLRVLTKEASVSLFVGVSKSAVLTCQISWRPWLLLLA